MGFEATPASQKDLIEGALVVSEALQFKVVLLDPDRHDIFFLRKDVLAGDYQVTALLLVTDNIVPGLFEFGEGAFKRLWRHTF